LDKRLTIYPNPFINEVNISSPDLISQIVIRNVLGQIVQIISEPEPVIQTHNLVSGVYIFTIKDKNENIIAIEKLVHK